MSLIQIIPKSKRARNRIHEHGEVMELVERGTFQGQRAIRVMSLRETWGSPGRKQNWHGWFTESEADWEKQ